MASSSDRTSRVRLAGRASQADAASRPAGVVVDQRPDRALAGGLHADRPHETPLLEPLQRAVDDGLGHPPDLPECAARGQRAGRWRTRAGPLRTPGRARATRTATARRTAAYPQATTGARPDGGRMFLASPSRFLVVSM